MFHRIGRRRDLDWRGGGAPREGKGEGQCHPWIVSGFGRGRGVGWGAQLARVWSGERCLGGGSLGLAEGEVPGGGQLARVWSGERCRGGAANQGLVGGEVSGAAQPGFGRGGGGAGGQLARVWSGERCLGRPSLGLAGGEVPGGTAWVWPGETGWRPGHDRPFLVSHDQSM